MIHSWRADSTRSTHGLIGLVFPETELPVVERRVRLAQAALDDATATVQRLRSSLEDLLRRAEVLRTEHGEEARRTADGVRGADDGLAPPEPGWFDQAVDWAGDHLGEIGDVAGIISAVAGTLALFPPLAPIMAPIALVAGGVALLAHGADMVMHDRWNDSGAWLDLGADAVGLLPGVKALPALADGASFAFHTTEGIGNTIAGGASLYGRQLADAGPLYQTVADRVSPVVDQVLPHLIRFPGAELDPAVIAKGREGTVNLTTQLPAVAQLTDDGDYEDAKDAAGQVQVLNGLANTATGTKFLEDLGRLVR